MYGKRNIDQRSCNHCCTGEVITVTQPECVSVYLVMQHAMRMHHTLIRGFVRSAKCSTLSNKR